MKRTVQTKGVGGGKVNPHQSTFELKQRIMLALNKLADRDTCQIGINELEKIAGTLAPQEVPSFLSCVLETDKEQKSALRRECVRSLGVLAMRQERNVVNAYIGRMVGSIVKRLRDPDSVVRDACVETVGILASRMVTCEDSRDGIFVSLVRPLFESLGEQNKQIQCGSALCLARIIDNVQEPPFEILQRMLVKTVKMLKSPHFMAKPAVIELNKSILQAGGAPSKNLLSAAMNSIQESLKEGDWTIRKAASVALGELATSGGMFLGSFKLSCIKYLESCRFDKVKPVREAVLHSIQCWKTVPGPDSLELSETSSSIKENFGPIDYAMNITGDSSRKEAIASEKHKTPLSAKRTGQSYAESRNQKSDWHVEIAVPKSSNVLFASNDDDESEGSSITKTGVITSHKQESSSLSSRITDSYESKFMTGESTGEQCSKKVNDRRSLDSTLTETSSQLHRGCCSMMANEVAYIRKTLLEIERKQSNILEIIQVFSTGVTENLSDLQSKILSLEREINGFSDFSNGNICDSAPSKHSISSRSSGIWDEESFSDRSIKPKRNAITKNNLRTFRAPQVSSTWRMNSFICEDDIDSAYQEALRSGDNGALIEFTKKTGPVLESLSHKTVRDILTVLISHLSEQKLTPTIIPWIHQLVSLSNMHGQDYLVVSAKARRDLLAAMEAAAVGISNIAEKRCVSKLAAELRQLWGSC